ncbi:MAG: hypothetical protein KUL79_12030 [Thauera sp.]|nr:hypothetical protein [Thauera sp.]
MKIANLIRKRPREAVATAIPAIPATELGSRAASVAKIATVAVANAADLGEGGEQAVAGIATVAVAKPNKGRVEGTAPPIRATRWLIHFLDREPMEVWFAPAADHAEALAAYRDALAAEPIRERTDTRTATVIERDELLALVEAVYAGDTDADRAEALDAALADPEGALQCYRAIAAERGITVVLPVITRPTSITVATGCKSCRHRKRPGRSDPGYCSGRDDLPKAYGDHHPLRKLPADLGATCASYTPVEG